MIEINLVPDVKQELIKAQRVRASVISIAILVGIVAVGVVVVLAIWVFAVQTARDVITTIHIKTSKARSFRKYEDISNTLTIQNQLSKLVGICMTTSILTHVCLIFLRQLIRQHQIMSPLPSLHSILEIPVTIEAQAVNGYPALEVFKKTIGATKFEYTR